ncbi:hypothetical protein CHH28_03135 [Bacterioplanes sanyensis]|uniref:Porin domain-containing protein n=1 Tax=Bacterioplanes sanyensis TaxID=1249553 RepID=A0A222FF76_9GAMM|nr:hypothetical protein [Bacterioplanes sanyensis]ASP37727.1 hypothetical protein CHH28_03135 [Bacterioplanes sanyensis]
MRTRLYTALTCAILGTGATATQADDSLNVYGFINIGAYYLDEEDITIESYQAEEARFFERDTMMGLQVSKQITDATSATVQMTARGEDDFAVKTSLAFVSHAINDQTDLRFGRLRIPFFYYSEFLDVGYAYNWVRPSSDVYSLPFADYDGFDVTRRFSFDTFDGQLQVNFGRRDKPIDLFGEEYESELNNFAGITLNLYKGNFGFRAGAQQTEMNLDSYADSATLGAILQGTSPQDALAALTASGARRIDVAQTAAAALTAGMSKSTQEAFNFDEQDANYYNLAVNWDNGDWSAMAETAIIEFDTGLYVDNIAWLASVAKRFGAATVHATYSKSQDQVDSGEVGDVQEQLKLDGEDESYTLGLRYDLDEATAFKLEATHHNEITNRGEPGTSGNLYRMAVQLVF